MLPVANGRSWPFGDTRCSDPVAPERPVTSRAVTRAPRSRDAFAVDPLDHFLDSCFLLCGRSAHVIPPS